MMRRLFRFRLRSLLAIAILFTIVAWWVWIRPREATREQLRSGRALIHNRDQSYLRICFDDVAKKRLITVVGDSRLTHWGRINWLAAPSADELISFSDDGSLLFWNRNDGSIRRAFYDVTSASYCSEVRLIAMSSAQGKIRIWSCDADAEVSMSWNLPPAPHPGILASPDGQYLIQFGLNNSLLVWNRETGQQMGTIPRSDASSHIEFCPARKLLLWADANHIQAYELATASLAYSVQLPPLADGGSAAVYAMATSLDGNIVYVGDAAGRVLVFDTNTQQLLRELSSFPATIRDIAVSPSGLRVAGSYLCSYSGPEYENRLMTIDFDRELTCIDVSDQGIVGAMRDGRIYDFDGSTTRRMKGGPRLDATCFAFSPDSKRIALAGRDGQIEIRSTSNWERLQSWKAHDGWIRRLVWQPRGDYLLSLGDARALVLWDTKSGSEVAVFRSSAIFADSMARFNPDGDEIATFGMPSDPSIIRIFDFTQEETAAVPRKIFHLRGNFEYSADGKYLLCGGHDSCVYVWDVAGMTLVRSMGPKTVDNVQLAVSPTETVVYAHSGQILAAFDYSNGSQLWRTGVASGTPVCDVSHHPTRPLLAVCGKDGMVSILDANTGKPKEQLRLGPPRAEIWQVDFSPDGELLAVAMSNGAVVILQAE